MKTLALIDGDELVYKAGFASQYTVYSVINKEDRTLVSTHAYKQDAIESIGNDSDDLFELDKEIIARDESIAFFALNKILQQVLDDIEFTEYRIYLSGKNNFREKVATLIPYKGNRINTSRPIHYDFIKQTIIDKYGAKTVDGIEADDALSITQWDHIKKPRGWDTIICTQDKDLKMVPGWHYNPTSREIYQMHSIDARLWFYIQLMIGDATDNIPGIYRVGERTARKLLDGMEHYSDTLLFEFILNEYHKATKNPKIGNKTIPKTKEDLIEVARLLWMLQEKDQVWFPGENYYGL